MMEESKRKSCNSCGAWWRLPLLLGFVLAAIVWSRMRSDREVPRGAVVQGKSQMVADRPSYQTVSLTVDFGDGRRKIVENIAWRNGMTVADVFSTSGAVAVTQKGTGASALLTSIDGVTNEGTDGRNWTYAVNGQVADRSFAIYQMQPGDRVLWTFGRPQ
ncbi:MAG TPA: DUF4430 domain-containing protein [Lacipirellulaceae bacterium]|nr:DUF4430 domain-containing protein [Lacipirellulaceae bacterium]